MSDEPTKIALFEQKEIRKVLHSGEWWFVISDVVAVLTESTDPSRYLRNLRLRDSEFALLFDKKADKGASQIETPLKLPFKTAGGVQKLPSWNTEGIFRLIQSIPSKKAEPMKLWLAKTGYERIQEIENPSGYAVLTSEISKAAFGVTPSEYKKLKGIKRENLRDHMTDLELLFSQLGEAATTEITRAENAEGMPKLKDTAKRGGSVAGTARKHLEAETQKKVISEDNFLGTPQGRLK